MPTSADALIAALHEPGRENLLDLVRNPLCLTLLCMTWDGSSLPETQADLYARYLKKVYQWNRNLQEWRDHAQRCSTNSTNLKQDLNRQLGELAKVALNLPQERFRLSQALVEEYLGEELDKTSLGYLALRLGWLNRVGRDGRGDAIFAFYHATFQEYFAALAVEDWDYFLPRNHVDRPVAGKQYRIFEPQWKQVILLWLGREDVAANDKLEFESKLATFNGGCWNFYLVKSFFIATEGISQLKDIDMQIPYKNYDQYPLKLMLIEKVVGVALWDFDLEPKRWSLYSNCLQKDAQEVLKRTTRSKVIAILELKLNLISMCCSINSAFKGKTQSEIEAELKKICPDTAMANLTANNMRCLEEMRVYLESTGLGYGWGVDSIFFNFVSFLYNLDPHNKSLVFSLPFLIATTENPKSRLNAINWLLTIAPDHPALIEGLVKTMVTAVEWRDRNEAAQIIGKVNPGNPFVMNWLLELLEANQNENYRWQIAYHLGLVDPGNNQAQAVLLEIVETTQSEDVRWFLAESLEKYEPGNPGAIAVLLKIIETANREDIIRQAFQSLRKIGKGHPELVASLLKIIETTDNKDIIHQVFWTLEEFGKGHPELVAGLLKIIETTDNEDIIHQVFRTLKEVGKGHPELVAGLLKIIETAKRKDIIYRAFLSLRKIGKGHPELVTSLLKIIEATGDESNCCEAAYSLQTIDPGNLHIIPALIKVIETTDNEDTRYRVACYLQTIDPENPHIIPALVKVIETNDNEDTLYYVAKYLHRIDPENPHLIPALVRVIETTDSEDTCCKLARYLHEIDPRNSHVIPALVRVIETTDREDIAKNAVGTFGRFECGHPEAIRVLSQLTETTKNIVILEELATSLGKIDPGNPQAISTLLKLAETSEDNSPHHYPWEFEEYWKGNNQAIARLLEFFETAEDHKTLCFIGEILEEIGKENSLAISGLMKILQTNTNQNVCVYAAYSLAEIDPKNPLTIPWLVKAMETNEEEFIQWQLACQLGKIDSSNELATECLISILETTDNREVITGIEKYLNEVGWDSYFGISVIVKLLKISRDKPYEESPIYTIFRFDQTFDGICHGSTLATSRLIELIQSDYLEGDYSLYFEYLKRTIATQEQKEMIISSLHSYLSDETYRDNFNLYLEYYKLFWDISQDLPYPQFYQAWHYPPTTPHPEVEDNTPVASTPFTQHCNLSLLPQSINQAIQSSSQPLNRQIICIDGSRFSDRSNPALQIYTTLKKAACPAITDKPRTISELQAYCEDDLSDHQIALILYEEPTDPPPQGFDIAVLNQLARFSHPPIAVVVGDRLPNCRLPQFLESDPNLIANILQWLHNLER